MTNNVKVKHQREPLFHLVKRDDMVWWKAWLIRAAVIALAVLFVGFLSMLLTHCHTPMTVCMVHI